MREALEKLKDELNGSTTTVSEIPPSWYKTWYDFGTASTTITDSPKRPTPPRCEECGRFVAKDKACDHGNTPPENPHYDPELFGEYDEKAGF